MAMAQCMSILNGTSSLHASTRAQLLSYWATCPEPISSQCSIFISIENIRNALVFIISEDIEMEHWAEIS